MVGMNIASFNDVGSSSSTALYTRDRERERDFEPIAIALQSTHVLK